MHSNACLIIMVIGFSSTVNASPIPITTTVRRTSPGPLKSLILSGNEIKLATGNDINAAQTEEVPTTEKSQTTLELTTGSDSNVISDVTTAAQQESSTSGLSGLTQLFRRVRSVTTESIYETTTTPFVLERNMLQNTVYVHEHLVGLVEMKCADMETDYPYQFDETAARLSRPVFEANLRSDSAQCVNIQDTLVDLVQILDAFTPYVEATYVEAMENRLISLNDLRDNISTLASPAVIPTSGTHPDTVLVGTQETIYTLIALRYQNTIMQEVLQNLLKC